jgi:putative inorganic carbon (HCO3(-)) transporter
LTRLWGWNSTRAYAALVAVTILYGLALTRLSLLNAFLLVFFSLVGVGALIEPLVGLLATLFLGILWAWLRAELPAVPALIAMPVLAWTLGAWLMRGAARREIRLYSSPALLPLLLFVGAAAWSLWDAVELPVYGLPELIKWLQILALFWLVVDHVDARRLPWLLAGLLAIGLFQALLGLWQFGLRGSGPRHLAILGNRFFRAYGTFEQPNPYAGYLGLVFPLGVGILAVWGTGLVRKWRSGRGVALPDPRLAAVLLVATGAMGAALVASWSRGGWLGMGAALVAVAAALPRRAWLGIGIVLVVLVGTLGLGAVDMLPGPVAARLTDFTQYISVEDVRGVGINDANYAVIERLAHWQVALDMWRTNFWNGVGFGDYEPAYPTYALINWPNPLGHAHNYYLNLAAETGLLGLVAYLFLWGAVLWWTWRLTRRPDLIAWQRGLAIGLLGAWTHLSVHHLFDNLYVNNVHLFVGVLLGVLAVLASGRGTAPVRRPANTPVHSHPCADPTRPPMPLSPGLSG